MWRGRSRRCGGRGSTGGGCSGCCCRWCCACACRRFMGGITILRIFLGGLRRRRWGISLEGGLLGRVRRGRGGGWRQRLEEVDGRQLKVEREEERGKREEKDNAEAQRARRGAENWEVAIEVWELRVEYLRVEYLRTWGA